MSGKPTVATVPPRSPVRLAMMKQVNANTPRELLQKQAWCRNVFVRK
jgi:hypothetical protein